jgi:hypothetical protein
MKYVFLGLIVTTFFNCYEKFHSVKTKPIEDLSLLLNTYKVSCTKAITFDEMMTSVENLGPQAKIESRIDSVLTTTQIASIEKGFYKLQSKPVSNLFAVFGCFDDKLVAELSERGSYNIWVNILEPPTDVKIIRVFTIRDNLVSQYFKLGSSGGQY